MFDFFSLTIPAPHFVVSVCYLVDLDLQDCFAILLTTFLSVKMVGLYESVD